MSAKLENGRLESREPHFENGEFVQEFTFRAKVVIGKGAIGQITQSAFAMFQRSIEMNKLEHSWPPGRVEITPHGDFMGFEMKLGTLAREPAVTVIHMPN